MDLYVELYGRGNECYFKHFKREKESAKNLKETYKDNYIDLESDITEGILSVDESMILIEYDGEEIFDGPLKESGITINNISKEHIQTIGEFTDAKKGTVTLYWGHDGMVNFSIRGEIEDFSSEVIEVYTSQAPQAENLPDSEIIISLECEEAFIDEEDYWFDPKMGYWGPFVQN